MANYAIGDIQGCYEPLRRVLDKAGFDPATDRLWSVGDLINRGDASLHTLRFLQSLGAAFTTVLGNHDLHLLARAIGARPAGKKETLGDLLAAPDAEALCDWVRTQPLLHLERLDTERGNERFLLVHAGIAPAWSPERARELAREVEDVLRGPGYRDFLREMYGNSPDTWDETLRGMARLRLITNYLTRMRFCTPAGKLDFSVKTGAGDAPTGYRPWYEFTRLEADTVILFGHWAALDGRAEPPNIFALDTGCVWGRRMTLLRLEDRRRIVVDCG